MKTIWMAVLALLVSASAGLAAPPAPLSSESLAQILGLSAAPAHPGFLAAAKGGPDKALCSATAICDTGTVSCNGNNSATSCAAFDRSCPGERGRVVCDGVTTPCPTPCPATCTTGTIRQRACCRCAETGGCADCDFCAHGFFTPGACG